jgi:hypothetical protein
VMGRVEAAGAGAARAWTRGWLWVVALCGAAVLGPPRGGVCAEPNPSELSHSNLQIVALVSSRRRPLGLLELRAIE